MVANRTRESRPSGMKTGACGNVDLWLGGTRNPPHNRKGAGRKLFAWGLRASQIYPDGSGRQAPLAKPPGALSGPGAWGWKVLAVLALAGLTVAVFGRSISFEFVDWDDPVYVLRRTPKAHEEGPAKLPVLCCLGQRCVRPGRRS